MSASETNGHVHSTKSESHHQSLDIMSSHCLFTPPTPIVFPSKHTHKTHTTASYSKEPITELVNSNKGHWAFSLQVPIPHEMAYPTLESLKYTVKYGTEHSHGTSAVQTSITLTKASAAPPTPVSNGVIRDSPKEGSSRAAVGLHSQMRDGVPVLCLSSAPAVKETVHASKWEYYVDKQEIVPHVRIVEDSRLHLHMDVAETPSKAMLRSLVVDVSATWVEDAQGKAMHDKIKAAEARIHIAENAAKDRQAEAEQARLNAERKSAEARKAREKAEQMEKAAKKRSDDDQHAKRHADEVAASDRIVKKQADNLADSNRRAKEAADGNAHRYHEAQERAKRKAAAEHEAEKEAEAMAEKERKTKATIEHGH